MTPIQARAYVLAKFLRTKVTTRQQLEVFINSCIHELYLQHNFLCIIHPTMPHAIVKIQLDDNGIIYYTARR